MRVVILDPHPRWFLSVFICFETGSEWLNAPFFLKRQYIESDSWENLFFPWRSPLVTYDPLKECKCRNYSLFREMGGFWGKGRTPGERWPKCLQLTQLFRKNYFLSMKLLVHQKIGFQNSKLSKITLFWRYFLWRNSFKKITSNKGDFWQFWVLKTDFLVYK